MHSRHSDGTDSVPELVEHVRRQGLAGFSITDHDTTSALAEAVPLARAAGLEFTPGIELSLSDGGKDIHLLLYRFDPLYPELVSRRVHFRAVRRERYYAMAAVLFRLGIELELPPLGEGEGFSLGRPHLAALLVAQRKVGSVREAFERYLAVGKPAYVPKAALSPEEGIALGREAGGVTVLAHPASYPFEPDLESLVDIGLQGVETSYPSWDAATTSLWRSRARKYNLVETGGSDYHGSHRGQVRIGDAGIGEAEWSRLLTT